jgi:predicted AlkP superfamily phosphohydrolase/phosphomutase
MARPPFWSHLDAAGRRCIVFDAFMDWPLDGFRGVQIREYGTWTWFGEPGSSPAPMLGEIRRRFGPYPGPEHMDVTQVPANLARFRDRLVAGATKKAEVTRWLMREHAWDMLFVTFGEPHGAGHYLWHVEDALYPSHPPGGVRGLPNPVRDVYVAVDRAIGEILTAAGDEVTVLVFSGDGMGPNYSGCQHIPPMLSRMGLLRAPETTGRPGLAKRLRQMIPLSAREWITRCLPKQQRHMLATGWMNTGIDWAATKAFLVPNSNEAYLRLNLEGREPLGRVAGDEAAAILRQLEGDFARLFNPANGELAAERVTVVDDVFPGPERRHLPDLVVSWRNEARVQDRLAAPGCGEIQGRAAYQVSPFYTGNHRALAFCAARGPRLSSGGMVTGGHILDIPPTVMALCGVDAPPWFEGRPWGAVAEHRAVEAAR